MEFMDYVFMFLATVSSVPFLVGVVLPMESGETRADANFRRLVCGCLSAAFLFFVVFIPLSGGSRGTRERDVPPVVPGCVVRVIEDNTVPFRTSWYAQVCKTGHREYADSLSGAIIVSDLLGHGDGKDVLYSTGSFQVRASSLFYGGYFVSGKDAVGNDFSFSRESFQDAVSAADEAASGTGVRVILNR